MGLFKWLLLLKIGITCCFSQSNQTGKEDEGCICVPYYQCMGGKIVTDGRGLIDRRGRSEPKVEKITSTKLDSSKCGPFHVCCFDSASSEAIPYHHKCGKRNPASISFPVLNPRRLEAAKMEFGGWPWQAAIVRKVDGESVFHCGATLIDNRHIITVAQCVEQFVGDKNGIIIRLGEWDVSIEEKSLPFEDYEVQDIFIHDQYNPLNLHNDIAVVRLSETVEFQPHIDSVCLPHDDNFTGQQCIVTGWGKDAYRDGKFSLVLKEVALPIISNQECQSLLRETRLGPHFILHEKFMCAGGKGDEDVCKGDRGGPLVCYRRSEDRYSVVGLVSWGIDCGVPGMPGVYVDVRKFIDFITCKTQRPLKEYWI